MAKKLSKAEFEKRKKLKQQINAKKQLEKSGDLESYYIKKEKDRIAKIVEDERKTELLHTLFDFAPHNKQNKYWDLQGGLN